MMGAAKGSTGRRAAAAIVSCLVALTLVPAARADHTSTPAGVALVGSLQSELGCPGDWQPECAATELQPVAGSPAVFRGTFTVPAGAYEYKVALNDSWNENYGAGGASGGANIALTAPGGPITFTYDHRTHVITDSTPQPLGRSRGAHWLRHDLIAWNLPDERAGWTYRLHVAPEGGLTVQDGAILGGTSYPLTLDPDGLPAGLRRQDPHLAAYEALVLPVDARRRARELLTGQLIVAAYENGALVRSSGLQIPRVLDQLYDDAYDAELGPTWDGSIPSLAVWAPTAKNVDVLVDPVGLVGEQRVPMALGDDGVWRVTGAPAWRDARYRFDVRVYVPSLDRVEPNLVTDPYSLGLTRNSQQSILVDLDDPALTPAGWEFLAKPRLAQPEDTTIYELHVRDFSASDEPVPEAHRGRFKAFTHSGSAGMRHLRRLADAGLNTVHLLPINDIASIEEDPAARQAPACDLASLPPDSEQQQACISAVRDSDAFNWGYDPFHYTAPEGSYATEPDGTARTLEFRELVKGLNATGLRAVIDVVYNHTPAAGQDPKSVLDRVVPGYYQRLEPTTGSVETSTCCQNTATEHRMMEKLMIDSVITWAREYKVDGFRFDLMGHHSRANMVAVREALDRLTPQHDGVDGRQIYVYGEGWDFGEVAGNARFVNATQRNMAGAGIGTFNDRLRDAVRGGGPFDADMRRQGFASGLFTDPNDATALNGTPEQQKERLLLYQDQIRVGLTGNLRDYTFVDRRGQTVKGSDVDYNGAPVGYAADPSEAITYVEAHDNETLFDALQYKLPPGTSMADRVRMNTIALATTALAQSPSFWHAGTDLLRSKSLDHNSYNSGDWFNRIDWSGQESTWGSGLPPEQDNRARWPLMRPLLADPALKPGPAAMASAHAQALDLLRLRFASPLLRLGSADLIQERVSFPNGGPGQTPGVIVMAIDDRGGRDVDPASEGLVVVFNASDGATTQAVASAAGRPFVLHPVQAAGADPVVRASTYAAATGSFTVPARTVAVFTAPNRAAPPPQPGPPVGACANPLAGTARADNLAGTQFGDTIHGGDGDDVIQGRALDDCLFGEAGNDKVWGQLGKDALDGGPGDDRLWGDSNRDALRGRAGADVLHGGSGDDRLDGGIGDDRLDGGAHADRISGGAGDDRVVAAGGDDRLSGGRGRDLLSGGPGRNAYSGGPGGDDIRAANARRETISCGAGVDRVEADRRDRVARDCERVARARRVRR